MIKLFVLLVFHETLTTMYKCDTDSSGFDVKSHIFLE